MEPRPGPELPSDVATALAAVTGSVPIMTITTVDTRKIKRYNNTNEIVDILVSSDIGLLLSLI
jgi:hypothetical protein